MFYFIMPSLKHREYFINYLSEKNISSVFHYLPLNISDIQDPDGIIISGTFYEFTPGGYSNAETIEPGKGYWIRANNSGNITLDD